MHNQPKGPQIFSKKRRLGILLGLLLCGILGTAYFRYTRPIELPTFQQVLEVEDTNAITPEINWPLNSQASIGTVEDGILASKPGQAVKPTASTAKLITVLTVLKEKPLSLGEQGPLLTINERDMRIYNEYVAANGSLVAVSPGEQLTQYQMLQGILIRSGNNLADSLAIWAFGSLSKYQIAAQKLVDELGMANTTVGTDASGLSSTTTSTAEDLTRLGIEAMKHDVVREIVGQKNSNLPIDGQKPSTNWMLGQNGVIGIKTGNIPEVGGVFVIASEFTPEGESPITLVGAVQGEPSTYEAIARAGQLAEAAKALFVERTVLKKGAVVATISTPWGETSDIIAAQDITTFGWKYKKITPEVSFSNRESFEKNAVLGHITIDGQSSELIAVTTVNQPSWQWRLFTDR